MLGIHGHFSAVEMKRKSNDRKWLNDFPIESHLEVKSKQSIILTLSVAVNAALYDRPMPVE